jgi:beta-phosphoglucomutase-like phosphatase (HAD superfamily)
MPIRPATAIRPDSYTLDRDITAVIFGVDGVVLDSAQASATAWKSVLDPFLRAYATLHGTEFRPFDAGLDYVTYMAGKPRTDGVPEFLLSRRITLPFDDVRGLAGRQEQLFLAEARRHGVAPFATPVTVLRTARRRGIRTAAVSGDPYAVELLSRVGVADMFDVRLDALDAPGTWLPGHSERALFLEAARRLATLPARTAVVEAAPSAVGGAARGGFGVVIGVDRIGRPDVMREDGATVVVTDLADVQLRGEAAATTVRP